MYLNKEGGVVPENAEGGTVPYQAKQPLSQAEDSLPHKD